MGRTGQSGRGVKSNLIVHGNVVGRFVLRLHGNGKKDKVSDSKQDDSRCNRQDDEPIAEVRRDHGGYRLVGIAPKRRFSTPESFPPVSGEINGRRPGPVARR